MFVCLFVCLFVFVGDQLATGRWFSQAPPVSSTNKTDPHDITVESGIKHHQTKNHEFTIILIWNRIQIILLPFLHIGLNSK
jgi:hypothetical protein